VLSPIPLLAPVITTTLSAMFDVPTLSSSRANSEDFDSCLSAPQIEVLAPGPAGQCDLPAQAG
jgi:hypothetical protein